MIARATARYAAALGLGGESVRALFAFTWARAVASFLDRLDAESADGDSPSATAEWLAGHRGFHTLADFLETRA